MGIILIRKLDLSSSRGWDDIKYLKYIYFVQVLLKGSNNYAYGVEYERFGRKYTAKANKEVILSAGAIGSPKILMLSGIGPKAHLESLGVRIHAHFIIRRDLRTFVIYMNFLCYF